MQSTTRSEEHTSELQSPAMISYAVFCLKKNLNYTLIKIFKIDCFFMLGVILFNQMERS